MRSTRLQQINLLHVQEVHEFINCLITLDIKLPFSLQFIVVLQPLIYKVRLDIIEEEKTISLQTLNQMN